jgi:hypothetical protein
MFSLACAVSLVSLVTKLSFLSSKLWQRIHHTTRGAGGRRKSEVETSSAVEVVEHELAKNKTRRVKYYCYCCLAMFEDLPLGAISIYYLVAPPSRICTGISRARPRPTSTSAPGLGPSCHMCSCHIGNKAGLTPATSACGLGPPLPRLHQDWAHPSHVSGCTKTGPTPATSASGTLRFAQVKTISECVNPKLAVCDLDPDHELFTLVLVLSAATSFGMLAWKLACAPASAPALASPLPHPHRRIPAASAPGLGSPLLHQHRRTSAGPVHERLGKPALMERRRRRGRCGRAGT